jgi:hypothetical protein
MAEGTLRRYMADAGRWGIGLMTGGIISLSLGLWGEASTSRVPWWGVALAGFLALSAGQYLAYKNKTLPAHLRIEGGDAPEFRCGIGTPHKLLRVHNAADVEAVAAKVDVEFDPFSPGVTHLIWHHDTGMPALRETSIGPGGYAEAQLPGMNSSRPEGYVGVMTARAWAMNSGPTTAKFRVRAPHGTQTLLSVETPPL